MKPLYLRISGFGPFPGTHEMPLEKMGEAGVFLVTGDTGSGKTTIFDAICFALYGETSGGVRNPEQLRSQYCEPMTETSVELSFLCRDKFYRVYRNLEYKRKKLSGAGMTVEGKNATLYSEDGTVLAERVEAVNAKIIEITGMRANQFRQIIMIAQGAFQKFLFSSSTEKEDILRQLFQTYACKSVQELLKSKTDDAAQVVQNEEREICYALHQIAPLDEEAAAQYQLLLERDGAAVAAELCQMLQQSGETAAAQLRSLTAEKQKRQKTSDTLLQEIERGKAHNQTLRQLEEHPGLAAYTDGAMRESVRHIVGVQLRNLATVGGSIYGRFGFSDVLTMFLAMDTEVELYKAGRMPLAEFAKQIGGRDILVKLIVHKNKAVYHYQSVRNTQTDFPVLTCAAAKRADGAYRFIIGARPGRAVLFEASAETIQALVEEKQKVETKADADTRENKDKAQIEKKAACLATWVRDQVQTSSNMRGSAEYRKHLTGVLIKRAVRVLEDR